MTHRAVDAEAGVPQGTTSNHFRTRDALFEGVVERFAQRERAAFEDLAGAADPRTRRSSSPSSRTGRSRRSGRAGS
ncbi:hypothetical protein [Phytohabitans suffuscus]|uniref:hypothetical protein n=1 Tax=Phytohabitans suffuscus TaxID=624315 RepID=UPI001E2BB945|nr:hypothetical protein [Phytohabitans suffuscus]